MIVIDVISLLSEVITVRNMWEAFFDSKMQIFTSIPLYCRVLIVVSITVSAMLSTIVSSTILTVWHFESVFVVI